MNLDLSMKATFAALGVAVLVVAMASAYSVGNIKGKASERSAWEARQAEANRKALDQAEANAAETARRFAAQQAIINQALREKENARADANRAAAAGERLRKQIASLAASCASPGDPSAIGSGATAAASGDLLNGMLERLDEAANRIARHADEARAAGLACERSYDALTK